MSHPGRRTLWIWREDFSSLRNPRVDPLLVRSWCRFPRIQPSYEEDNGPDHAESKQHQPNRNKVQEDGRRDDSEAGIPASPSIRPAVRVVHIQADREREQEV